MNKSNHSTIYKTLALILATTTSLSMFTGCFGHIDATKLPLVPMANVKTVKDYYDASNKYESVVIRNNNVSYTQYEKHAVTDKMSSTLTSATSDIEDLLSSNVYNPDAAGAKYMSNSQWNYTKAILEDKELSSPEIQSITEADGHYFVDVQYRLGSSTDIGEFTQYTSLVGIHGAFVKDAAGTDRLDTIYLPTVCTALNNHYSAIGSSTRLSYDGTTFNITSDGSEPVVATPEPKVDEPVTSETGAEQAEQEGAKQEGANSETPETTNSPDTEPPIEPTAPTGEVIADKNWDGTIGDIQSANIGGRSNPISLQAVNELVGAALQHTAYMPELSLIYSVPDTNRLTGMSIFPQGDSGVNEFGYDREDVSGKALLRYVYKQNLNNPTKIDGVNCYIVEMINENSLGKLDENTAVPEYIQDQLKRLIERQDRAIVNNDISGMQRGTLYTDMGMGLNSAYKNQNGKILRNISNVKGIVARDIKNNTYLLDVETFSEEGQADADVYGTYLCNYYIAAKQVGQNFYITDWVLRDRELQREPDINPDDAIQRRLIALNLTGEVPEESREIIRNKLADYYLAANGLHGNDYTYSQNNKEVKKPGLYTIFDNDQSMLSTKDKNYQIQEVVNALNKHGDKTTCEYKGTITTWIGGTDNQIEIQADESFTYAGIEKGGTEIQKVYYLFSKMGDSWVIDERKVLSKGDSSDASFAGMVSTIDQNSLKPTITDEELAAYAKVQADAKPKKAGKADADTSTSTSASTKK